MTKHSKTLQDGHSSPRGPDLYMCGNTVRGITHCTHVAATLSTSNYGNDQWWMLVRPVARA